MSNDPVAAGPLPPWPTLLYARRQGQLSPDWQLVPLDKSMPTCMFLQHAALGELGEAVTLTLTWEDPSFATHYRALDALEPPWAMAVLGYLQAGEAEAVQQGQRLLPSPELQRTLVAYCRSVWSDGDEAVRPLLPMLDAYQAARRLAMQVPDPATFWRIAALLDARNQAGTRPQLVVPLERLLASWEQLEPDILFDRLLQMAPLALGNRPMAAIIYQWRRGMLDSPAFLPHTFQMTMHLPVPEDPWARVLQLVTRNGDGRPLYATVWNETVYVTCLPHGESLEAYLGSPPEVPKQLIWLDHAAETYWREHGARDYSMPQHAGAS